MVASSSAAGRSRYRPRPLTQLDGLIAGIVLLCPIGLAMHGALGEESLHWVSYPLAVPTFSIPVACCIGLLAAPLGVRGPKAAT